MNTFVTVTAGFVLLSGVVKLETRLLQKTDELITGLANNLKSSALAAPHYETRRLNLYTDFIKCGDSAKLLKELPDESIDLTITSPPYDNLRTYNGYSFDFETIAKELYRVTRAGGGNCLDSSRRSRERERNGY